MKTPFNALLAAAMAHWRHLNRAAGRGTPSAPKDRRRLRRPAHPTPGEWNNPRDPHSLADHDLTVGLSLRLGHPARERRRTFRVPTHARQRHAEKRFQREWNARAKGGAA